MPVTYDLYGDRSGNTRNVLVEPNRVSWLKRHFARIRYGPRSGTGRIPFCAARPGTAGLVTPHVHAMAVKLPFGVWERSAKRACVLLSEKGVVSDDLALHGSLVDIQCD